MLMDNLPKKYFTNFTASKPVSDTFLFFGSDFDQDVHVLLNPPRVVLTREAVKQALQEGPGFCLNWFVLTFWPAGAVFSFIFQVLFTFRHA